MPVTPVYRPCFVLYSFIQKPRKGVKFLQERGLVGKEPTDVARFFFDDDRLDRVCYFENCLLHYA